MQRLKFILSRSDSLPFLLSHHPHSDQSGQVSSFILFVGCSAKERKKNRVYSS